MEYVHKLDEYPKDLFSESFNKTIDKTKNFFKNREEYINKPMIRCCVLGNTSTGKSTVINALLEKDILYEGIPEATLCVAKCQSSLNNDEYFEIYTGNVCSNKPMKLSEIKLINKQNEVYSKYSMDLNNYLDIYLNIPSNNILQKCLLIDCPGFDNDNLEAISKYCDYADIIIFCFKAKEAITDNDIDKINKIKSKLGKFQISFIINCCDEFDVRDEHGVCKSIDREEIIEKLSSYLTGKDAIFFISAKEEKQGKWNVERHGEFERFKKCLQEQKSLATVTYRKVHGDLLHYVKELLDGLKFTNFQKCELSESIFEKLEDQIKQLINNDKTKYYRKNFTEAIPSYAKEANKEISKFLMKQFVIDYNLNEGIINENYFYKWLIQKEAITEPTFSWLYFGDRSSKMKKCFIDYFSANLRQNHENIRQYYIERRTTIFTELEHYKSQLNGIIENIKNIMF